MKSFGWAVSCFYLLLIQPALADIRLPAVFGSHMVLQRRKPVPVWGWAAPGEKVTVTLNGTGLTSGPKTVTADKAGKWRVSLDPLEAGGPYQLVVVGRKNTVSFDDVLVGEVWVCSGQSNMEFQLANAKNGKQEVSTANYPQIRQLLVKKALSLTPRDDIQGQWSVCSPRTAANFTAVGYYFARQLQQELNVPIGLLNTTWGGTHSETWTSREGLSRDEELRSVVSKLPSTDAEVVQTGMARIEKLMQQQQGSLPTTTQEQTWSLPDTDVSQWKTMSVPTDDWEWRGLPTLDGVVWFRRSFDMPEGSSMDNVTLQIGPVNDRDSTYVNGQLVGSTSGQTGRSYRLPNGLLKPGRNVIAIRVIDTGGVGGIMGPPEQLRLTGDKLTMPLSGSWQYRVAQVFSSSYQPGPNTYATQLFNAMLNPLIPYAIEGVIWYQGESNAGRAYQYRRAFPLLIQDWRQHWGYDFPFLFVQLASFNASNGDSRRGSSWAELREAQTQTLQLPNTGMAVTTDIGEPTDIHPKNKADVGKRLAAEAMRVAYMKTESSSAESFSTGPQFSNLTIAGNRAVLTFRNTGKGLMATDKYGYLKGFEVAGTDQKFYYAKASITGNTVVVQTDSVAVPVAVRYGWADDNSEANLYNKEGFPAVPFRTDTWKGITEAARFGEGNQ